MKTTIAAALAAAAMIALPITTADASGRNWQPCPTDDGDLGIRCFWDAQHMGNGDGVSYLLRKNGAIRFVGHARAHRLLERTP